MTHSDTYSDLEELIFEICQNLTATERRTWLQLVDGVSILDVAAAEGVSRTAIYERSGFRRIPPFGPYRDDPVSLCYEKALALDQDP